MLSRFSVIAVLLLVDLSFDAAPQKGVILANEVGGTPMAKVTVTAAVGLGPKLSDSLGALALEFPQKQPDDTVKVIVKRDVCAVVNDYQLESALPARVENNFFITIFSNEREREEIARRSRRPRTLR